MDERQVVISDADVVVDQHVVDEQVCKPVTVERSAISPITTVIVTDDVGVKIRVESQQRYVRDIIRRLAVLRTVATGSSSKDTTSSISDGLSRTGGRVQVGTVVVAKQDGVGSMPAKEELSLANFGVMLRKQGTDIGTENGYVSSMVTVATAFNEVRHLVVLHVLDTEALI